jgi:hypothetical protein
MFPPPPRLQPAIFGGLFIGVLSALPLVNIANCCCLWVIGGGVLATYLMQQNHPFPISSADGALVGLLAGLFGGLLWAVLSIPVEMMMAPFQQRLFERILSSNPDIPDETRLLPWRRDRVRHARRPARRGALQEEGRAAGSRHDRSAAVARF